MEEFKFFSRNENIVPRLITSGQPEYDDLQNLWCKSIFDIYVSPITELVMNRKYRINAGRDEITFMIIHKINLFDVDDFSPFQRLKILFQVNGINIFTFMLNVNNDRNLLSIKDISLSLSTGDDINEWETNAGF